MKIRASTCSVGVVGGFLLLVIACGGGPKMPEERADDVGAVRVDSRGFDPLELPRDLEVVPLKHPVSGDIRGRVAPVGTPEPEVDSSYEVIQDVPDEIDSLNSQAYRVQIFAGKLYGEAKRAVAVAEEIFDRPVSLDYEVPYFKVRVGSFADREKAELYQQRARTAGYANAWVVVVNVGVKEAPPLYDEPWPVNLPDSLRIYERQLENDE